MIIPNMNLREHLLHVGVEEELRRIIYHVAGSAKYISAEIHEENRKLAGTTNTYGEEQLELDVLADRLLKERLERDTSFGIKEFVSEEQNNIVSLNTNGGRYSVSVDPLDGSSLVDANLSVGTIVGMHEGAIMSGKPGRESMVAAMYILYGPLTTLVYTAGKGTHEFVLDNTGNYILSDEFMKMNDRGAIYSPGGLKSEWLDNHANFIQKLESDGYKLRYSGAFVPDINQLITSKGGLFTYPKLRTAASGKLRLLFELQPMAMLVEQAQGKATDGYVNILDKVPEKLDQRSPIYIGSKREVELANEFLRY